MLEYKHYFWKKDVLWLKSLSDFELLRLYSERVCSGKRWRFFLTKNWNSKMYKLGNVFKLLSFKMLLHDSNSFIPKTFWGFLFEFKYCFRCTISRSPNWQRSWHDRETLPPLTKHWDNLNFKILPYKSMYSCFIFISFYIVGDI